MFITVNQLAEKVNNLQRFTMDELQQENNVIKIIVELTNNGTDIAYYVDFRNAGRKCYTEQNVPVSLVRKMNCSRIVYHEKTDTRETMVYSFVR